MAYLVAKYDKNMEVPTTIQEEGLVFLNALEDCFEIKGVTYNHELGQFERMPEEIAKTVSEGVTILNRNTSGGRLRFTTNSPYIVLKVEYDSYGLMDHMPSTGSSSFDLYLDEDGKSWFYSTFRRDVWAKEGFESIVYLPNYVRGEQKWSRNPKAEYSVTINFPLYNMVNKLYIGLQEGCSITAPMPYREEKKVVYYGSSITQGGCASRPGNSYQAMISRRFNWDYLNLGFSGNAKGEQTMIDYIAGLDMSVLVMDYDHNAPTVEHLRNTHEHMFREIRKAHPELPIVLVSKPDFKHIDGMDDAAYERKEIIRTTYNNAIAAGDKKVYFLDGETLFEGADLDSCTVDGCHPNDLGFFRMAQKIGGLLGEIMGF